MNIFSKATLLLFFPLFLSTPALYPGDEATESIITEIDKKYDTFKSQVEILTSSPGYSTIVLMNKAVSELQKYLKSLTPGQEQQAMTMLLQKGYFISREDAEPVNYPLFILLYLCGKGYFTPGDEITFALSFANSYIYSFADTATRRIILSDCEKHYHFYKDIIAWQIKSTGIPWSLDKARLIPKILWCDRSIFFSCMGIYLWKYRELEKHLTLDAYKEYIDDIDVLRELHAIIKEKNIATKNIKNTASGIEEFVHANRFYGGVWYYYHSGFDTSDKELIKAEKRAKEVIKAPGGEYTWNEMFWINGQYRRCYKKYGEFVGQCDVTTVIQAAFYRAAGIVPLVTHWISRTWKPHLSHVAPAFYDPVFRRWRFYQMPDYSRIKKEELPEIKDMYFQIVKPVWHPWVPEEFVDIHHHSHFQGEKSYADEIINFQKMGMDGLHYEKLFITNKTMTEGLLFSQETAPRVLKDTDNDTLPDQLEKAIGTDPARIDTDEDSASDSYEYNTGTNPCSGSSKLDDLISIDGFSCDLNNPLYAEITDEKGDATGDIDISTLHMFMKNGFLYMALEYEIRKGGSPARCFINIDNNRDNMPEIIIGINPDSPGDFSRFKENYETCDYSVLTQKPGCEAAMAEIAEFKISPEVLGAQRVNLYAGFWGDKGSIDGINIPVEMQLGEKAKYKDSDNDGASDAYEYSHGTDYLSGESRPGGFLFMDGLKGDWKNINYSETIDEKGDAQGDIDIRKVCIYSEQGFLYLFVEYDRKKGGKPARCFINIDNKGDDKPEINIGINPDSPGDFSRFKENYETYDYAVLTQKPGCEAGMAEIAEFKLSGEVVGAKKVHLYVGFWGKEESIDGVYLPDVVIK
ncbi:MAG: hypothetical protein JXB88_22345 [Spirochaetales bacterium]|nr:hypothetical protein [Spirochaetales bacterium]